MIKYFTTNNTTNAQLQDVRLSCNNKYDGLIISQDRRKIIYQPKDNTSGFSVGQTDYLVKTSTCNWNATYGRQLIPGMKYIQDESDQPTQTTVKYYVPIRSFGIKAGDTVELYITHGSQILLKELGNSTAILDTSISISSNSFVVVKIICESVTADGVASWSAYLTAGGSALNFDTHDWSSITGGFNVNKKNGQALATSALYNSVSGLLTNQKFWDNQRYYFDGSILSGNLSISATVLPWPTVVSSNVNETLSEVTSTYSAKKGGVVVYDVPYNTTTNRILSSNINTTSGVINGRTVAKYVQGQMFNLISSTFNVDSYQNPQSYNYANQLIRTTVLPSAEPDKWGITRLESGITSGEVKDSPYPWQASACYEFLKNMMDEFEVPDSVSAVKFNNTVHDFDADGNCDIGIMSTQINGVVHGSAPENLIDLGNNFAQVSDPVVGQYVIKTADGYTTDPGIATLSSIHTVAAGEYQIDADGKAIPILIQSPAGKLYPIQKGSMTVQSNTGHFIIDLHPYTAYDNVSTPQGTWKVYYGAGINNLYTTANTVVSATVASSPSSYNILFETADVHVLRFTTAGTTNLLCNDLEKGHGMIIKIVNPGGRTIQFGGDTIITSTGTYSFSLFNFGSGAERVGEVTNVY